MTSVQTSPCAELEIMAFAAATSVVIGLKHMRLGTWARYSAEDLVETVKNHFSQAPILPVWVSHGLSFFSQAIKNTTGLDIWIRRERDVVTGQYIFMTPKFGNQEALTKELCLCEC